MNSISIYDFADKECLDIVIERYGFRTDKQFSFEFDDCRVLKNNSTLAGWGNTIEEAANNYIDMIKGEEMMYGHMPDYYHKFKVPENLYYDIHI